MLRVLIAEDEAAAREGLTRLLAQDPELDLLPPCATGRAAIDAIREQSPDLVLLDVQMPNGSGLDVIRDIGPDAMPPVIFVTAFDAYAIEAFEAAAVDYIVKPFTDERLHAAISRAKRQVALQNAEQRLERLAQLLQAPIAPATRPTPAAHDFVAIRDAGQTTIVRAAQIDWIEAERYCTRVHTGTRAHLVRQHLKEWEDRLAPHGFVRVNRSVLVNLAFISRIEAVGQRDYEVVLRNGNRLPLPHGRRMELGRLLGESI